MGKIQLYPISFIQNTSDTGFSTCSARIYRVVLPALLTEPYRRVFGWYHSREAVGHTLRTLPPCTAQSWATGGCQDALADSVLMKKHPVIVRCQANPVCNNSYRASPLIPCAAGHSVSPRCQQLQKDEPQLNLPRLEKVLHLAAEQTNRSSSVHKRKL